MKLRYDVDWTDSSYPMITRARDGEFASLDEAKADVYDSMQSRILLAKTVIKNTKALRAKDIPYEGER